MMESIMKLEELLETLKRHAKQAELNHEEFIKSFKEDYPGEPFPDYLLDTVNVSEVLAFICEQIIELRDRG